MTAKLSETTEATAEIEEFDALHYIRNSPALHDVCQALRERGERNEAVRQAAREKEARKAEREAKRAARMAMNTNQSA